MNLTKAWTRFGPALTKILEFKNKIQQNTKSNKEMYIKLPRKSYEKCININQLIVSVNLVQYLESLLQL